MVRTVGKLIPWVKRTCLIFLVCRPVVSLAKVVSGQISAQGDTVHLELLGEQDWNYDVQRIINKKQTQIEMTVNPLDERTVKALTSFKSDLVPSIAVDEKGPDGRFIVHFNLANGGIESFDYLTDQPSRLILDFYLGSGTHDKKMTQTSAAGPLEKITELPQNTLRKTPARTAKGAVTNQRKPATSDVLFLGTQDNLTSHSDSDSHTGIFDGGDPNFDRFMVKDFEFRDDAKIRAKENYYIAFPMLQSPGESWEKIKTAPAVYQITPKESDENKQARLLLTLFEKGRYAVFLKTVDWFKEKYPQSEYNEIVDFMAADAHLTLWKEKNRPSEYDEALMAYKNAIKNYPKSPLVERSSLKLGFISLEKGDALGALRLFKEHIDNNNFAKSPSFSKDLAQIGNGMALAKLNRFNEAIQQFTEVEKNSTFKDLKMEAAFRRGDVAIQSRNFAQAIEEYKKSLQKYPEAGMHFPNAYYNQAESLFNLENFKESLDVYRDFIKKFPTNEYAPFAMTRLGELMDVLGADRSRVMGAYLETYFRYGENPSAIIARLHLLSARMKGMKTKEVDNAVSEIMSLAKKLDLPNIEQFATVMVTDGFTRRGEHQKSIDLLTKYYQQNPTTVDRNLITRRIVGNISNEIRSEVDKGQFIQALKTHQKYEDNWLKGAPRLDIKYDLGRSFEMAGVPIEAEKYYRDVINRMYALRGTPESKEIAVVEKLPTEDEVNLRLAAIMAQENKFSQAYDYLNNIKKPANLSEENQIERVDLAVKLLEDRGDTDSAIRYLTELLKNWKGQPTLVADPYLRLSELEMKQNKSEDAIKSLVKIDELMKDSGKVSEDTHFKSLQSLADIYLEKKQPEKAIAVLQNLLEKYENKKPVASLRYKLGEIFFKRGDVQKAADVWHDIKGVKSDFWKNLAQEQLKNSEWRDGYKKYIKRIPAMSDSH